MVEIDKITMAVGDMAAVKQFYADVFNLSFTSLQLAGRELFSARLGAMELLLCPKDLIGIEANVNTVQLRFVVDDVQGAFERGVKHGVVVINDVSLHEGRSHASLRDPDGNSLELIAKG